MKRMVWKRWAAAAGSCWRCFCLLVVRLNQVGKVALVSREGQTFEKGVVTEILQDNVQPDGSRVGEQVVRVLHEDRRARKGREIETTSSSGFLFGRALHRGDEGGGDAERGGGHGGLQRLRPGPWSCQILAFAALYLLALCLIGGWQGAKGALGPGVHLRLYSVGVSALGVPGLVPLLERCAGVRCHRGGDACG